MNNFKELRKNDFINMALVYNSWIVHNASGWLVRTEAIGGLGGESDYFQDEQDAINLLEYLVGVEKTL